MPNVTFSHQITAITYNSQSFIGQWRVHRYAHCHHYFRAYNDSPPDFVLLSWMLGRPANNAKRPNATTLSELHVIAYNRGRMNHTQR